MASREPKISPSIGMMAGLAPKTSRRVVAWSLAMGMTRTTKRKMPPKTTRHPGNARKKNSPARDLRGNASTTGVAMGSATGSPGAVTGSSSVMGSALRRGLRNRRPLFFFFFFFAGRVMLFGRRNRGRMFGDLGLRQRRDGARRQADLLVGPVGVDDARAPRFAY